MLLRRVFLDADVYGSDTGWLPEQRRVQNTVQMPYDYDFIHNESQVFNLIGSSSVWPICAVL
jgi:hypothetical protein